jgi:hypothetical protein
MKKILTIIIASLLFTSTITAQEFESARDVTPQELQQQITKLESLYNVQDTVCILGALFRFSNVELTDGKLVLYYTYKEGGKVCDFSLYGKIVEVESEPVNQKVIDYCVNHTYPDNPEKCK